MNKLLSNLQYADNTIQPKLPLSLGVTIDINDPVVTFREVLEGVNLKKYLVKDSDETRGRHGYDYETIKNIEDISNDIVEYIVNKEGLDISTIFIGGTKIDALPNKYTWVWKKACITSRNRKLK